MFFPLLFVLFAQVPAECLLSPLAVDRVGDGRKSRHGAIFPRVLEEHGQRSVSAHAVPEQRHSTSVQLFEMPEQRLWKLLCDVAVHLVAFGPWLLGGVNVETRRGAEVVGIFFSGNSQSARACVWVYHCNALLRCFVLEEAFLRAVVACASQTGEVKEHGDRFGCLGLRWDVEVEVHFAVAYFGL